MIHNIKGKYFLIWCNIEKRYMEDEYFPTEQMWAGFFSKPRQKVRLIVYSGANE